MYETAKLQNVNLYKRDGMYFLAIRYLVENDAAVLEYRYKDIPLFINPQYLPIITNQEIPLVGDECGITTMDFGFGGIDVNTSHKNRILEIVKIKDKVHEMTVKEIEKKLGYKIKIVEEKDSVGF